MNPNFSIRRFVDDDIQALRRIYLEARRASFPWLDIGAFRLEDFDSDTQGEMVWVAVTTSEALGFASVWAPNNFLHNLYVHPDHAGKGVGSALMDVCLEQLERPVFLKCLKKNEAGLAFYQHHGWRIHGEGVGPEGEYFFMCI